MVQQMQAYERLIHKLHEIATFDSISSLLGWDEQTFMPARGAELRATQSSLVARLSHEQFTSAQTGELLAEVEGLKPQADSDAAVNVREMRRDYDRARKLPPSLVEEMTRTAVLAQQAWIEARKRSDFPMFRPWLEKTLDLKRQEIACVGYQENPYDALLDAYEPHETTAQVRRVFDELRRPLVDLIQSIASSGRAAPIEILERHYPSALQHQLAREASEKIGLDYSAARLDISAHPFCSGIGPGDSRITTRYDEHNFGDAFFGVLHESGHALYDQGLPEAHWGTPLGQAVSHGIHESQSRFWENLVGRSRSFWRFFWPRTREVFGATLHDVSLEQWLFAVNDVRPSLIRTESDETTYNLHVLLRFEMEQALLGKDLSPGDLPGAWNEQMRKLLGIVPPDDARGCLQDIHWSGGSFGYFPSYTLGNLYAAQFYEQARKDIADLEEQMARGEFGALLAWLREKIHRHGKRYPARELVKRVTGRELSAGPLIAHLNRKAGEFYGANSEF